MNKNKKSKLETISRKITLIQTLEDNEGKYVGYCDYHRHRGVIGHMKAKACEKMVCHYYKRFREEKW